MGEDDGDGDAATEGDAEEEADGLLDTLADGADPVKVLGAKLGALSLPHPIAMIASIEVHKNNTTDQSRIRIPSSLAMISVPAVELSMRPANVE